MPYVTTDEGTVYYTGAHNAQLESAQSGGGLYDVVEAGDKTGTYAPAVTEARTLYNVTATGDLTFAPTGWDAGNEILLEFTQDGTGSHTLSVDDGSGARSVTVDDTAATTTSVHIYCRSTSDMDIEVPGAGAQGPQGPTGATGPTGPKGDPGNVSSDDLTTIVLVTQAEYDGLTPDANTLYIVSG